MGRSHAVLLARLLLAVWAWDGRNVPARKLAVGSNCALSCLVAEGLLGAGGPLGGVLVITVLQCNWFEACRVWNAPVLRENFGVPFFMMQMCGWVILLGKQPPHRPTAVAAATVLATAAVRASPPNVFTVAELLMMAGDGQLAVWALPAVHSDDCLQSDAHSEPIVLFAALEVCSAACHQHWNGGDAAERQLAVSRVPASAAHTARSGNSMHAVDEHQLFPNCEGVGEGCEGVLAAAAVGGRADAAARVCLRERPHLLGEATAAAAHASLTGADW